MVPRSAARSKRTMSMRAAVTLFVFVTLLILVWRGYGPLSLDHLLRIDEEEEPELLLVS